MVEPQRRVGGGGSPRRTPEGTEAPKVTLHNAHSAVSRKRGLEVGKAQWCCRKSMKKGA